MRISHLLLAVVILLCTKPTIALAGSGIPPPSDLRGFGDSRAFILLHEYPYQVGDTDDYIRVPAGFVTDLASIPKAFWGPPIFLTPHDQYSRASIIHDYLYWSHICTREQADRLLVIAMKESNVGWFKENTVYDGVHLGGQGAWDGDAEQRSKGYLQVLPYDKWTFNPNIKWEEYREQLFREHIQMPYTPPDEGKYCHYGDSRTFEVPHRARSVSASGTP